MKDLLLSIVRTAIQSVIGTAALWLAGHGLAVPDGVRDWASGAALTAAIIVATTVLRWLETRRGAGPLARAARWLGQVLMLGTKPPVYPTRSPSALPRLSAQRIPGD